MDGIKMAIAAAALGALMASHALVYRMGGNAERAAMLARSVTILRERTKTDDEMRNAGDDALCRALGGVWNNNKCE